jgi:hypothetical protein
MITCGKCGKVDEGGNTACEKCGSTLSRYQSNRQYRTDLSPETIARVYQTIDEAIAHPSELVGKEFDFPINFGRLTNPDYAYILGVAVGILMNKIFDLAQNDLGPAIADPRVSDKVGDRISSMLPNEKLMRLYLAIKKDPHLKRSIVISHKVK